MKNFKKVALAATCTAMLGGVSGVVTTASAANWLALQGTERAGQAPRAKVWGFIQPEYQSTSDSKLPAGTPFAGQKAIFNQIRPDLDTNKDFNTLRARIGVRGVAMPLDSNVNYFLLAEYGNNGVTARDNASVKLTDASVTLNHIDGARVRIGKFKTPGSEEGLQAIHVFDYINFTNVTNGLLLERFFKYDGSGTFISPAAGLDTASDSGQVNSPIAGVGAFRDSGIQVFNTFKSADWEHSYAVMYGNGNGSENSDNDNNKDTYIYWSSEQVYGGKGPRRQGWKLYAWNQSGKRTITRELGNADGTDDVTGEFDRKRSGVGTTYRKGKWRAAFEYITADGMIFNGSDGGAVPGSVSTLPGPAAGKFTTNGDIDGDGQLVSSWNMETKGEADGMYLHVGYQVTPKWEIDARYDVYNRMTDVSAKERKFETVTLGAQYFFNKKTRLILNYEMRDAEAPNLAATHNANKILSQIEDKLSAQILVIF